MSGSSCNSPIGAELPMKIFLCNLTEKEATVSYKNKKYRFEYTPWCGWVCVNADGSGSKKSHPHGAWLELQKLYPEITV